MTTTTPMLVRTPFAVALAFAGLLPAAHAFQPLITDDTGTQGAGGNQLEFAVDRDRVKEAGDVERVRTLPLVYTRGVSDALDVFVQADHTRIRSTVPGADASGAGSPVLGFKWRFFENEASKTSVGLKPEVVLPVNESREDKGLGVGRTSYGATVILTQEVGFGAVHANAFSGRERFRDKVVNPDVTVTRLSVAPVWDVSEQFKLALDVGSETAKAAGVKVRANFVEVGAVYAPNKDLDLALGFVRSTDDSTPEVVVNSVTAGVTWRF